MLETDEISGFRGNSGGFESDFKPYLMVRSKVGTMLIADGWQVPGEDSIARIFRSKENSRA
jgi:hypothetical protein